MRLVQLVLLAAVVLPSVIAQGGFELPVQLIGFPVIIIAVRMANFLKKLSYALNPNTYKSRRNRRGVHEVNYDPIEVEKRLVAEMGQHVCIYERVCTAYASQSTVGQSDIDWNEIFRKFASSPKNDGENYLLSVFLGDIVGSPSLCRQLAKRGRSCDHPVLPPSPQPLFYHHHLPSVS